MKDSRVLIVDDDEHVLNIAALFFQQEEMKVHCAVDGEEALRKIEERSFLLMITDFNMPGMDGLELARRAGEMAPHMPILMCTGDSSPEIESLAKEAGVTMVLAKPFRFENIVAIVRDWAEQPPEFDFTR